MRFGVITFPGSNCDQDMVHVLRDVMGREVIELWHQKSSLGGLTEEDCIVLPGGFSYGDYVRPGAIANRSNIMSAVKEHAGRGGMVLGICNGFQVLCEAGLLPGALLRNADQKFIGRDTHLQVATTASAATSDYAVGQVLSMPIAHADGRYVIDDAGLKTLLTNDQILFYYCDAAGVVSESTNPNGSVSAIAGITNEGRNVFGMMPHPERAAEAVLGNQDGYALFSSLLAHTTSEV